MEEQIIGFVVLAGYVVMFWTTRWRFVFRPNQHDVLAKIRAVRATAVEQCQCELLAIAERQLNVKDGTRKGAGGNSRDDPEDHGGFSVTSFLTWNGAREIHAWRLAHEAERHGVRHLSSPEVIARAWSPGALRAAG